MAPVSPTPATPPDTPDISMQSFQTTLQQFKNQSPQLFWLVVCVFSFSFGLSALYFCYKIVMFLWKGPRWNDDPRLIPPPKELKRLYSSRLASRSDCSLYRTETEKFKQQLQESDHRFHVVPITVEERKFATMTRRSWTQSLLARATLTVHQGTGVEIRLGDEFEKYKTQTLQEAVALVSPLPSLFEKEVIAAPRPCVVKGTGVACPPSSKAVHPAADSTNEIPQVKSTDGKRSSCGSEASVYSQASVTSTLTELANLDSTHFSEPDDSVPSIMVQSCDSPSSKFSSHSSLSSLQTPPSPDSPSFAFCRQSPRKEYLQVPPSRILGSTRPRARPPSFASSRGTSHAMGRRRALEHANGVARGRGKENAHAGRTTPEKAKAAPVFIPCPTRNKGFSAPKAPLAVKERARDVPASSPWPF